MLLIVSSYDSCSPLLFIFVTSICPREIKSICLYSILRAQKGPLVFGRTKSGKWKKVYWHLAGE